jgi:hypothetical protein
LFELYKSNENRVQFLTLIFNEYSVVDKKMSSGNVAHPPLPPQKKEEIGPGLA